MEQKKFQQQYRAQYDVYTKAAAAVKKHGKRRETKTNRTSASYDKEIKVIKSNSRHSTLWRPTFWNRFDPLLAMT